MHRKHRWLILLLTVLLTACSPREPAQSTEPEAAPALYSAVVSLDSYYTEEEIAALAADHGITLERVYLWAPGETGQISLGVKDNDIPRARASFTSNASDGSNEGLMRDLERLKRGEFQIYALTIRGTAEELTALRLLPEFAKVELKYDPEVRDYPFGPVTRVELPTKPDPAPEAYPSNPFVPLSALETDLGRSLEELFPGFAVSETDGGYCFDIQGREEYLLLDGSQTLLTAVSGDSSARFAIPRMFPTSVDAPVTLHLADVTGEGREELVYLSNYTGTGRSAAYITVVDLDALKEIPVDWKRSKANLRSQAETLFGEVQTGDYLSADWSDPEGVITLEAGFTNPEARSRAYLCLVRSPLTFDAEAKTLIAQGPYEIIPT